jgi:hypothetical protein
MIDAAKIFCLRQLDLPESGYAKPNITLFCFCYRPVIWRNLFEQRIESAGQFKREPVAPCYLQARQRDTGMHQ